MLTIDLAYENGENRTYGIMTIFSVDDYAYAALAPLDENGDPINADILIYGCEITEEGDYDIWKIEDKAEYEEASKAFQKVIRAI